MSTFVYSATRDIRAGLESADVLDNRGLNLAARVTHPTWGAGMPGVVKDFTPGEATLLLNGFISQGTTVDVEIQRYSFEAEVLYCERRGDWYEVHVSIHDFDQCGLRRTPRFPVNIPCRIFAFGLTIPGESRIVDISGDGLGMETRISLPVGRIVAVESESNIALGIVRHSRELSPGHVRIGVELHHIIQNQASCPFPAPSKGGFFAFAGRGRNNKSAPRHADLDHTRRLSSS